MSYIFDFMSNIFYSAISSHERLERPRVSILLKSTYVHLFTATVIFTTYGFWVFGVLGIEYFTGQDALIRIGRSIGLLIIVGYAFEIIVTVAVIGKQTYRESLAGITPIDERDKQILYKSMFNSHLVLCGGLFLSIGALAIGIEAFWVFNTIVLGFLFSVIAELCTKLYHYRLAS